MIPQLIWVFLSGYGLADALYKHGEFENDVPLPFIISSYLIVYSLYWWGGLFDVIGIPEVIMIGFTGIGMGIEAVIPRKTRKRNIYASLAGTAISAVLLYWGGFFDCFLPMLSMGY